MKKEKRMGYRYGSSRMNYNTGGNVTHYKTIQEKERKCNSKVGMNTMKIKGEK